ncbi:uncharacterized protein LOC131014807 isoform X1 [Salvia miltiorrhiza]|uniref:uncharacterized protein LOC131014807 isoform X1 n=1 Tax=Salvia miltiorrhiza TaxID=226208 RepID=UPI0025AD9A54|nr:uncharacterized protein LOC131014807 isoform X1 [Salvia miltiorrhiza]
MASSLISKQNFQFQFPSLFLHQPNTQLHLKSCIPNFPSSVEAFSHLNLKLKHRTSRASSEDLPSELAEDSKFVPLTSEDSNYGPPVSSVVLCLALVTLPSIFWQQIQQFLKELDGEFLEVIFCTEDMINRSLWEAVNTKQSNLETLKVATSVPRICFLSGLTGEEMMMFIDAFPESGLEPPIFAALVPHSADKPLAELIDEIMGDHEMLSARQTS